MKAIITIGIPCSGKTTWAEAQEGYVNLNRDDVRVMLFNLEKYSDYSFSRGKENKVSAYIDNKIIEAADANKNIIISDTNLNQKYRKLLADKLSKLGYHIEYIEFHISFEEALKRNDYRLDKTIPRSVMYRMWKSWLNYKNHVEYKPNSSNPPAYIFDIDGTLADMITETLLISVRSVKTAPLSLWCKYLG